MYLFIEMHGQQCEFSKAGPSTPPQNFRPVSKDPFYQPASNSQTIWWSPYITPPPPTPTPAVTALKHNKAPKKNPPSAQCLPVQMSAYLCAYAERRCVRHVLTYLGSSFRSNELALTFLIYLFFLLSNVGGAVEDKTNKMTGNSCCGLFLRAAACKWRSDSLIKAK